MSEYCQTKNLILDEPYSLGPSIMLRTGTRVVGNSTAVINTASTGMKVLPASDPMHTRQTANAARLRCDMASAIPGRRPKHLLSTLQPATLLSERIADLSAKLKHARWPAVGLPAATPQERFATLFEASNVDLLSNDMTYGGEALFNGHEAAEPQKPIQASHIKVSENPPKLCPTPWAIVDFMDQAGYQKQYIGAVYEQLDRSGRLFDLDPEKATALQHSAHQKITDIEHDNHGDVAISTPAITKTGKFTDDGQELFLLKTAVTNSDEAVLRTREEIALHLMIENHLIAIGQSNADSDVFEIALPQVKGHIPVAVRLEPADVTGSVSTDGMETDESNTHVTIWPGSNSGRHDPHGHIGQPAGGNARTFATIDKNFTDTFFGNVKSSGAKLQTIGGENFNCWMRAAWLSTFIQCSNPDDMKHRLLQELDDRLTEKMPSRPQSEDAPTHELPTIAKRIDIIHRAVRDFKQGRLSTVNTHEGPFSKDVDDAITVVSQALLMKDLNDLPPLSDSAFKIKKDNISRATIGNYMGNTEQICTIMCKLGVDMIAVSPRNGYLETYIAPESDLNYLRVPAPEPHNDDRESSTGERTYSAEQLELIKAVLPKPMLHHEGAHFQVYARGNLWRTGARYDV